MKFLCERENWSYNCVCVHIFIISIKKKFYNTIQKVSDAEKFLVLPRKE